MSKSVLILGASSSIARAVSHAFASKGYTLYLAGRDVEDLARLAGDVRIRYDVDVKYGYFDAEEYDSHLSFIENVVREMQGLEGVLLAFGYYADNKKAMADFSYARPIIAINYTGACSILTHCCNYLCQQKKGFIIGISSVAGDRGRQSNYVYGSAKAGLSVFLEGMRGRAFQSGVRVLTVKPGFVDTAMTLNKPDMFLVASPEKVGNSIVKALEKGKDVVYVPWFWRYIMWIIRSIPEFIFKRLKL